MQPIVRAQDITKAFDTTPIVKGASFQIGTGDLAAIIGPAGCGKSTLLRCLNGLEALDSGSIEIFGVKMAREPGAPAPTKETARQLRQNVGMVLQGNNLFPHKTLLQNVMMAPMVVRNAPRDEAAAIAERVLEKVGLAGEMDRYPIDLSGGQQQRGAIARALALAPKVMLYDAPTAALEQALVDEVLDVMKGLGGEGLTQIVVTDEIGFAREACDRTLYMEDGEIVEVLVKAEGAGGPKDPRTQTFLGRFA